MCFCYNTVLNTYSLRHTGWFSFAIMIKLEFRIRGIRSNKNARKKCHFYISQSGLSSSTHISSLHFSIGDIGVVFHFCREVFWSNKASIRDFCSPQIQIGDFHRWYSWRISVTFISFNVITWFRRYRTMAMRYWSSLKIKTTKNSSISKQWIESSAYPLLQNQVCKVWLFMT